MIKNLTLRFAAFVSLAGVLAPASFAQSSCADYPRSLGVDLSRPSPGVFKISFTEDAPIRRDTTTSRDIAWRRAKARARNALTTWIQTDLKNMCEDGEVSKEEYADINGIENIETTDGFSSLCNYSQRSELIGFSGIVPVDRCATPGDMVMFTVGLSTGTQSAVKNAVEGSRAASANRPESPNSNSDNSPTTNPSAITPPSSMGYSNFNDNW